MDFLIQRVYGGWAALGDGWAVFGATPEDVRAKFLHADQHHKEIAARVQRSEVVSDHVDVSLGEPGQGTSR